MKSLKFALLLFFFLSVGLWLSAASAVLVMNWAGWVGGAPEGWLADKGWSRVMRRCAMLWAAVFLAVFLKRMGWAGWKDSGFVTDDPRWSWRPWWSLAAAGVGFGLATLGGVTIINMVLRVRCLSPVDGGVSLAGKISGFIASGIFVALIEETICRGILFRLAARLWNAWAAALVTSVLFSLAHFVGSAPESFQGDSFVSISTNVFVSTLIMLPAETGFFLRLANLTLLGILLCAFVIRTRTVWFGIGAHAAWVWVIKLNTYLTDPVWSSRLIPWLGRRGDFMDSIAATVVLTAMAGWTLWRSGPTGVVVRKKGMRWHVAPQARETLEAWLDRHFEIGPDFDQRPGNNPCAGKGSRVLKAYEGCRVSALSGWVLKEYRPKSGWKGFRFAIMPSRARRSFELARELAVLGIPTPEAVAWGVKRGFVFARAAYAITRELDNAESLTDWLKRNLRNQAAGSEVMTSYGRLMAMFHANGYSNRDFKHENVMCSMTAPARLWVVDLDGVSRKFGIFQRRAQRDLMRVGRSLAELGWCREPEIRAFFNAYNKGVPPRLRTNNFPS